MRWYLISFLALLLFACDVPKASPEKHPKIVIAIDLLTQNDREFFQTFEDKFQVSVEFREMNVDTLIQLYAQNPYNTGLDIILVHNAFDMRRVVQQKMLETIRDGDESMSGFLAKNSHFVYLGMDPFICVTRPQSSVFLYDDLTRVPYSFQLNEKSAAHFFAPFEERLHRTKTFKRMTAFMKNSVPLTNAIDSIDAILTTQSHYRQQSDQDSIWNHFNTLNYPNSNSSGVFYDVLAGGIVRQSSNYTHAKELLNWLLKPETNRRFNEFRGFDPIRPTGSYRPYPSPSGQLMQYHTMILRMLEELN
jgi:hypothetical protein